MSERATYDEMLAYGREQMHGKAAARRRAEMPVTPTYSQVVAIALDRLRSGRAHSRFEGEEPTFWISRDA